MYVCMFHVSLDIRSLRVSRYNSASRYTSVRKFGFAIFIAYVLYRLIGLYRVFPSVSIGNFIFSSREKFVNRRSTIN